ncbi:MULTISPECIES: aa3-type cytochrome c oxidase subunit IV [Neoroseomonas]|uniref:aa3-type cytochrome c oxidase subunit IV n=1 Tax=Neoroseomonas TaxID=2870716 RepID=UPI001ADEE975
MAEQQTHYDFVEVKSADILADRERSWEGFTSFVTWSTGACIVVLVLMYLFLVR